MMMPQTQTTQEVILIIDEDYEIIYKNDFASWLLDENILTITTLKDQTCFQVSSDQPAKANLPLLLNGVNQLFELNCILLSSSSGLKKVILIQLRPMQALEKSSSETLSSIENRFNFEHQIKLQSIALEAAANGVMITDRHGQILWVNSALAAMTGYTKEELIGKNPNILKSNLQDSSIYEGLWSKIIAGEIWQGEITNRRKDGTYYIEEQTIAPVLDPSGVTTNFIAIKSDISKRRELELIQNDMRETLVHDLRNPLNTILVSLELAEAYQLDNELAEILKISLVGARRMLGMVNSLLDISKIESGAMPVNPEAFAIEDEVYRTIQFQTPLAIPKKLILKFAASPNLPLVLADKELVQRIMQNLLDNAIKFSLHGGDITITTDYLENQKAVVVGIQDHGIGIPPEIQPRLFQKFASSSQTLRSSGLGLAFCKMAVEAMTGRIWVESSSASTRFLFSLPSAPE